MNKFKVGDVVNYVVEGEVVDCWAGSTVTKVTPEFVHFRSVKGMTGAMAPEHLVLAGGAAVISKEGKVRKLQHSFRAVFDLLKHGKPVAAEDLDEAVFNAVLTNRGSAPSTDATMARVRDLRKPIYGGHNIVYNRKARTYQLLAA